MTHLDNMTIDGEGHALPYSPAEVHAIVQRALEDFAKEL